MNFISGSQPLPGHLTRSRLSPRTQAISVRNGHGGLCSSPLDSRLYINSWGDRCSSEHCLLFVCFFFPPLSLSCLCCGERGRQKHYSCPCWVSRAVLSPCVSWSLARPSTRPLYFLVVSLNRPFYQQALCPPKTLLSIGCSISWGIIPIR